MPIDLIAASLTLASESPNACCSIALAFEHGKPPSDSAAIKSIGNLGTEEDALSLMIYSAKQKEGSETRAIHRILGDMAINNPDLFIEMFKNEQMAIKNLAYESLVTAGIEALPRLTIVAAESRDENQVSWCKASSFSLRKAYNPSGNRRKGF